MKNKNHSNVIETLEELPFQNPSSAVPPQESPPMEGESTPASITKEAKDTNRFYLSSTYFTICIYGLAFVALSTIIFITIVNWSNTINIVKGLLRTLTPFVVAFFIAYILNPLVKKIDQLLKQAMFKERYVKARKFLSIGITYLLVLAFITITILYITPELLKTVQDIDSAFSTINIVEIEKNINAILDNLHQEFPFLEFKSVEEQINEFIPVLFSYGTSLLSNFLSFSFSIVKTFINILLAVVISCYMLADKNSLNHNAKRILYAILPKRRADSTVGTLRECNSIFSGFIIGKSIDSLIIGLLCFLLMHLLGLDYAILLSIIVGVTNMIPYFGPFIGAIPGLIIYLFIDPVSAVIFGLMIFALQQFDGLYLGPKILGGSTGLTPLWVIFGITVGGAWAGPFGMFLGVPCTAVLAYLLNKIVNTRLEKKNIHL